MSEDTRFEEIFLSFINDKITVGIGNRKIKGYYNINVPPEVIDGLKEDTFFFHTILLRRYFSYDDFINMYFGGFFEHMDEKIVEKFLLEILTPEKLKTIRIGYIPEDVLETLLENAKKRDQKSLEVLRSLNYSNFYKIFKKFNGKNLAKEILKILPNDKIKEINYDHIPGDVFGELLKKARKGHQESFNMLNLLNYDIGDSYLEYTLKNQDINDINDIAFLLKEILSDNKIKKIKSEYIPQDELIKIIENPEKYKELFERILLLDYSGKSCELINFLENPKYKKQKKAILNFLSNLESKNLNNVLEYVNKEVLKDFIENSDEEKLSEIPINEIDSEALEEWLNNLGTSNCPKNLNLLDYSRVFYIKSYISNQEIAKNFFSVLGFEKIKSFNINDIETILSDNTFLEPLKSIFGKSKIEELKKELILRTIDSEGNIYYTAKVFYNYIEFIKFIENNFSQEEASKIDLSRIYYKDINKQKIIIETMLSRCPQKLPKIDTSIINGELLFKCLKEGNLKAENIISSDTLTFLSNSNKLKVVKDIIVNNNLFEKKENGEMEYNSEILKKLIGNLNKQEVMAFVKFYCENNKEGIKFNKNELEKAIKDNKIENNFLKKIHDDYIDENPELEGEKKGSYLLNRQENLYLLLLKLDDKLKSRFEELEKDNNKYINDEEKQRAIETRKAEIEENRNILANYIKSLKKCRKDNFTEKQCSYEEVKEILNFIAERYSEEILRRELLYYQGMIKPFLKRCIKDDKSNLNKETVKKITREIEESLGILYYPYSSDEDRIKAQKILKENLNVIGNEYKRVAEENGEKISGDFLMLSSVCAAEENNINDLSNALYATIKFRMADDYITKQDNVHAGENINSDILYRGFTGEDLDKSKVSIEQMSNPNAPTGRPRFSFWDMTKDKTILNTNCNAAGKKDPYPSWIGAFTSYSEKLSKSLGAYGRGGILGFYCISKNLQKSFSGIIGCEGAEEIAGYDIPIEYRIFNIVFNGKPLNEESIDKNEAKDDEKFDIGDVQFSTKMDFVNFKINLNLKENLTIKYINNNGEEQIKEFKKDQKDQSITKEELKAIIIELGKKGELVPFLRDQLIIERVFDRNKILGEEFYEDLKSKTEITKTKEHKRNVKKFLKTEKGLRNAQKRFKPFNRVISNVNNSNENKTMYAIPDTHGSYPALIESLKKSGIIANEGEGFVYYKKDDFALENPIYKEPKNYNEEDYIKIPNFKLNNNIKDDVIHLGDLVDKHSEVGTDESLKSVVISILISRQLKGKYITLMGNHEIANIIDKAYYGGRNQDCKNFILKAIENGEIKLMHHVKGTNIINSHVALIKENILNFLNHTISENISLFSGFEEKIKKLAEIAGFKEKKENGKIKYIKLEEVVLPDNNIKSKEVALLDNNLPEEVLEEFTDIINELFKYIVISEQGKTEKKLTTSLLGSLVNGNRMYNTDVTNTARELSYAQELKTKDPWTPEELKEHTFNGITNVIGHDATPNKEKIGEKEYKLAQGEYLNKAGILFADEWQEDNKAKCVKIKVNEKGEKEYYFYRQEKGADQFIEGDFVEVNKSVENLKKEEEEEEIKEREEFLHLLDNALNENFFSNEKELLKNISISTIKALDDPKFALKCDIVKNKIKLLKLAKQLINILRSENKKDKEFVNKLIEDNFNKKYDDDEIFINCIKSIDNMFNGKAIDFTHC